MSDASDPSGPKRPAAKRSTSGRQAAKRPAAKRAAAKSATAKPATAKPAAAKAAAVKPAEAKPAAAKPAEAKSAEAKPAAAKKAAPPPPDPQAELDALREKLLLATLPEIAFDGWTMAAMKAGQAAAGVELGDLYRAFPDGPIEMLAFHSDWADRVMLADMEEAKADEMRVRDRIAFAVRVRLERAAPDKEAIRRGLTLLAQPQHTALGTRLLWRTVDAIWHGAGDTSTDYNYYTKRMLLAGVYSSTLMFWLNDKSEGHERSWKFLDRRIAGALSVGRIAGQMRNLSESLPFRVPSPGLFLELMREGPLGRSLSGKFGDMPQRPEPEEPDAAPKSGDTVH
ncbi:MAG: COQ9 family protein [Alphaproteobacteria bacterium]|nr:COQ9 family protein [Alphaproteobacteria bacterium]